VNQPSLSAHVIVAVMAVTSFIVPLILLVQLLKGADEVERAWNSLALWVDDVLGD